MKFEECVFRSYPTGSRAICNPAPKDTDNDTVILVNGFYDWAQLLIEDGWEDCGQYDKGGDFRAFRKGEENYICTENEKFFLNYVKATDAARALNLLKKEDRISVFRAVMDASEGYVGLAFKKQRDDGIFEVRHGNEIAVFDDAALARAWNDARQFRVHPDVQAAAHLRAPQPAPPLRVHDWHREAFQQAFPHLNAPVGFNIGDDDEPEAFPAVGDFD